MFLYYLVLSSLFLCLRYLKWFFFLKHLLMCWLFSCFIGVWNSSFPPPTRVSLHLPFTAFWGIFSVEILLLPWEILQLHHTLENRLSFFKNPNALLQKAVLQEWYYIGYTPLSSLSVSSFKVSTPTRLTAKMCTKVSLYKSKFIQAHLHLLNINLILTVADWITIAGWNKWLFLLTSISKKLLEKVKVTKKVSLLYP